MSSLKITPEEFKEKFCTSIKLNEYKEKIIEIEVDSYYDIRCYKSTLSRTIEILARVMDEDDYYKKDIDIITNLSKLNNSLCLDSELEGIERMFEE